MTNRFLLSIACLCTLGHTHAGAVLMLGVEWSSTDSAVYAIDSDTGAISAIGQSGFPGLNSLVRVDARFYSISKIGIGTDPQLIEIDPATGAGTVVGRFDTISRNINGLAWSTGTGVLGVDGTDLFSIDLVPDMNGILPATSLGRLSDSYQGLAFALDNTLYVSRSGGVAGQASVFGLATVDLATLAITTVSQQLTQSSLALQFLPDGRLMGYGSALGTGEPKTLLQIDPVTGLMTEIGSTTTADIRGLVVIPEPAATLLLLGAGMLAGGARMPRRRHRRRLPHVTEDQPA